MLQNHLARLEEWISNNSVVPSWDELVIVEDSDMQHGAITKIFESALHTPDKYNKRFNEILDRGYSWVNLVCNGIIDNKLLISVEIPSNTSNVPADKVSVNISGPYLGEDKNPKWDLNKKVQIIKNST